MPLARVCSRCGRLALDGRFCLSHGNQERHRKAAKIRALHYGSPNWKRVRIQRLEQAGYRCELQLPGCTGRATHVHLDPALKGNHAAATPADCRACCATCSGAIDAPRAHTGT